MLLAVISGEVLTGVVEKKRVHCTCIYSIQLIGHLDVYESLCCIRRRGVGEFRRGAVRVVRRGAVVLLAECSSRRRVAVAVEGDGADALPWRPPLT